MKTVGYIYIMTNPAFPQYVKFGYAKDPEQRRKILSRNTGTPVPYEIYAVYAVEEKLTDKALFKLIDSLNPDLRVSKHKEFYELKPEEAFQMLQAIAIISNTEKRLKYWDNQKLKATNKRPTSTTDNSKKTKKLKPFRFSYCKIKPGDFVFYCKDKSIKAKVVDDKHVEYNGQTLSLSALYNVINNKPVTHSIAGPQYFTFNDKILADLRIELGIG